MPIYSNICITGYYTQKPSKKHSRKGKAGSEVDKILFKTLFIFHSVRQNHPLLL